MIIPYLPSIIAFTKSNPAMAAGVGLYSAGVVTFLFRDIPSKVVHVLKRELTTTLVIHSTDSVFTKTLLTIGKRTLSNPFIRSFNIRNANDNRPSTYYRNEPSTENSSLTIGYARVYFTYGNRLMFLDREVIASQGETTKEQLIITLVGRTKKPFEKLHAEVTRKEADDVMYTQLRAYADGCMSDTQKIYKRPMSTVVLDKDKKDLIINHLEKFLTNKSWCISKGLPWKTGILLYGPPGTGKTSLIKAIAAHLDKDIHIININTMTDQTLPRALEEIPEGGIVIMEDIDSAGSVISRESDQASQIVLPSLNLLSLTGILNAIDGVASTEGRILIATTNHVDKLDPAVVRPGRFDLKVEVGYLNDMTFREYLSLFYDNLIVPEDYRLKPESTPAQLQHSVMSNLNNPSKVLEEFSQ